MAKQGSFKLELTLYDADGKRQTPSAYERALYRRLRKRFALLTNRQDKTQ